MNNKKGFFLLEVLLGIGLMLIAMNFFFKFTKYHNKYMNITQNKPINKDNFNIDIKKLNKIIREYGKIPPNYNNYKIIPGSVDNKDLLYYNKNFKNHNIIVYTLITENQKSITVNYDELFSEIKY